MFHLDGWLQKALVKPHPQPFVFARDAQRRNTRETDELRLRLLIKYKISPIYHHAPGGTVYKHATPLGSIFTIYLTTILIILLGTTIIFTTDRPSVHFLIGSSSMAAAFMSSSLP